MNNFDNPNKTREEKQLENPDNSRITLQGMRDELAKDRERLKALENSIVGLSQDIETGELSLGRMDPRYSKEVRDNLDTNKKLLQSLWANCVELAEEIKTKSQEIAYSEIELHNASVSLFKGDVLKDIPDS